MNQVKEVDRLEAEIFMSGLYEKAFKREQIKYDILLPTQMSQLIAEQSVPASLITFNIPNVGLINPTETYLTFKVRIPIVDMTVGQKIIQRECKILRVATNGTETLEKQLPVSARCFLRDV